MSEITTIGLDLAKSVFQVHGVNDADFFIPNDPLRLLFEFRDGGEGAHGNKPSLALAVLVRGVSTTEADSLP